MSLFSERPSLFTPVQLTSRAVILWAFRASSNTETVTNPSKFCSGFRLIVSLVCIHLYWTKC